KAFFGGSWSDSEEEKELKKDEICLMAHESNKNFQLPGEVRPILPNQNDTMHERPSGKIRLYTRFFNYANFRLPLSTFLVEVEDFAYPASFLWHTTKHVTRDPDPVAVDFNAQHYATLVAHPSLFQKFLEAFMCLVGLSRHYTLDKETYHWFLHKNGEEINIFAFIHTPNPTKVRVAEREGNEDDPRLLDTTVGHIVPLLLVAPNRADSELEASVEKLVDEGGSGNQTEQGDSARGRPDANIQPVIEATNTVVEDAAPVQSRHQGKRKFVVVDVGGVSHPPKKLREDHRTLSGASVGGKSRSMIQRFLARAVLNAKVGVAAIPTLPFVTAYVSTTFVISLESSHHSGTNVAKAEVDSLTRSSVPIMTTVTTTTLTINPTLVIKEKFVKPSPFGAGSSSARGTDPITDGAYVILEKEQHALYVKVTELETLAMSKERKLTDLNALVTSVKSQNDSLVDRVHELAISEKVMVYENCMKHLEKFQDDQMKIVEDKFDKLYTDFVEMAIPLEEKFYPHILTTIFGRKWLLTHGMKLAVANCLNSLGYLSALGAAIGKAIEKGPLAVKLGLKELQPNVDQLMVPIHHSPDQVVVGATALSLTFDVFSMEGTSDTAAITTDSTMPYLNICGLFSRYWVYNTSYIYMSELLACSLFSSKRSRLISKASSFCTKSTFVVLSVGKPISAEMTTSVPYVNENGVSSLLDFIMAIGLRIFDRTKVLADA
nr:hypothetical protein [Tanacetum cinerariifolium]